MSLNTNLRKVNLRANELDTSKGTAARKIIEKLESHGVKVVY